MTLPQKQFLDVFNAKYNLRKLTIGFAVAIFFVAQSHAQEKTPRKEFFIKLSKYKIVLAPGEKDSIEVKILRSAFFKDLPIQLSVMAQIPGGSPFVLNTHQEMNPVKSHLLPLLMSRASIAI